jgi:hypothetical protein
VKGPNQKRYFFARFPLANSCAGKPIRHTQGRKSREARDRTAPRHRPGGALQ